MLGDENKLKEYLRERKTHVKRPVKDWKTTENKSGIISSIQEYSF